MPTTKPAGNDRNNAQPRTGHGAASVIPRLNEQLWRPESPEPEQPADDKQVREAPRPAAPVATPPGKAAP